MGDRQTGQISENSKRIAKNTLALYFRMFLLMAIGLYTSRVVLNALGETDFGIYGAVGGIVSMCSLLSGSLASAISRFLTVEIGKNDVARLREVFSMSIIVILLLAAVVFVIAEPSGVLYVGNVMNLPPERVEAARWVFQFSLLTFLVNLLSVPYNATIIAHEKMSAYAYISILEGVLNLTVALLIMHSTFDRLKYFSVLMFLSAVVVRFTYAAYCRRFDECGHKLRWNKRIFRQMLSFAGWSFLGNGAYMLNTQGVNQLLNVFFGVSLNAAREVMSKVETSVNRFVTNFITAINPQIMKSYAAGNYEYMYHLVCRGAKYSYFLLWILVLPLVLETPAILRLWLKNVPEYSVVFVRLSLATALCNTLGHTFLAAVNATGNVGRYQTWVTIVGGLVFPLSLVAFKLGCEPQTAFYIYFLVYFVLIFVRLVIVSGHIGMPKSLFVKEVFMRIIPVTLLSAAVPSILVCGMSPSVWRVLIVSLVSVCSVAVTVYFTGLTDGEKAFVIRKIKNISKIKVLS